MRELTSNDVVAAVVGGTILGGGGGGHVVTGFELGREAVSRGPLQLVSVGELPGDTIVAICAGVGAPGAPDAAVSAADFDTSLAHLEAEIVRRGMGTLGAVATNENGAMGTVNGWMQAASRGVPLLDCPCNGRAHPTALMGSLGLHRSPEYVSIAGYAGGAGAVYTEGVTIGSLDSTSRAVRALSVVAGGMVAVARNPVTVDFLARQGAPGGISQALAVGEAHARGGIEAVAEFLGGTIAAQGEVSGLEIEQRSGFDIGRLNVGGMHLTFVNEYMSAVIDGAEVGRFPDLIMTFDAESGEPVVSAHLADGQNIAVLVAPRSQLLLSATMDMEELMTPIKALLDGETMNAG